MADIRVKVIPDTKELDKELKKKRTFAGLLGFGKNGNDKESKKKVEKTNKILGNILRSVGIIAIVSTLLSGLIKLLRPFVELFTALSFLVFFPLWKALRPVLQGLSKLVSKTAEKGGGPTGLIRAGEELVAEKLEGANLFKRIGIILITGLLATVAIITVAILAGLGLIPTAIIAGLAAIVTLLILAWNPIKKLLGDIAKSWKDFWTGMKEAFSTTVEFIKNLGKGIWDFILDSLSFISNLGSRIWDFIKNALSGLVSGIGGGFGKVASFLNPFDDFIQRPGQSPTAFSPSDTIIGVKDPSKLFGGGSNVTQNISIQATINNDIDIQTLAQRLAELSKDELARSTASQRF